MIPDRFHCLVVRRDPGGNITSKIEEQRRAALPPGEILLRVRYSSLNYKDALAATGHPGIAKTFPHVPGIDAAGVILESHDPRFQIGDEVLATGHEWGVERWGGWSEYLSCPANWLVRLPAGLSLLDAMTLGTAGFTAAQCVQALLHHQITPDKGNLVVTGATGGVGSLSVMLLHKLGFRVVAVSGKPDQADWLRFIGAAEVAGRDLLKEVKPRPLQSGQFAGGIDTVGGSMLATLCKMIMHRGCVACCGMAGGSELNLTVFPFILRGLTLTGVDSAWCPEEERANLWNRLAKHWSLPQLEATRTLIELSALPEFIRRILQGENVGRIVVDLGTG